MRGRKPKPTALKILDGDRADRINRAEPRLPEADLDPPDHFCCDSDGLDFAREHWDELAPMLASVGLLTEGDRPALALLCEAHALIRLDPLDYKARDLYRRMLVEFGLTPSSRSRVAAKAETPANPLADFLMTDAG
ncbi:P27 family phage terminase small subunit [Paludisphaera sp.]|uniref:P27 family phage terminase small subunit n=1 Tax=Paludisphaera sp. TaxID=2017432 RepID=UPI00301E5AEA